MFFNIVYAAGEAAAPAANPYMQFMQFFPLILIFVVFWFLLIRPQQKRQKEHQEMLDSLTKGDKVITTGGIYGTVVGVSDKVVVLRVADNVKLEVAKNCIGALQPKKAEKTEE